MEPRDPESAAPEPRGTSTGATPDDTHESPNGDTHANSPGNTPERDSEETKVLGIEQSAATAPPATSHAPEGDPDWRPGLLPSDWEGRTAPRPAPQAAPDSAGASDAPDAPDARSKRESGTGGGTAPFFAASATTPKSSAAPARSVRGDAARRHGFDPMAMVAGAIFMAIAVMYMLDAGDAVDARPGLMLALAVIGVGASGFVGAVWAMLGGLRNRRAATAADAAGAPGTSPATGAAAGPVDLGKNG